MSSTNVPIIDSSYISGLCSNSVRIFIYGKGKEDFLTDKSQPPPIHDPNFKSWKVNNSLVMTWLLNSMTNEVGEHFLLHQTAKGIWDEVQETYSQVDNTFELFEVEQSIHDLKQGDLSAIQYFSILSRL
ncbi:hypothetical protein ZIOFF_026741 [Zingiber officinale]|uniref:UBN2_3 domain-containing protein n=1 Tax=Zingiber officinale TaxID=94328 RepID=A0A8J5LF12_ZINOF|nr:hypothetical protein ZIOFF_026741 [Zingiber officinale]